MTRKNIEVAAGRINKLIDRGKDAAILKEDQESLLSVVDEYTLLCLGCRHVKSFRDYYELPEHRVTVKDVDRVMKNLQERDADDTE